MRLTDYEQKARREIQRWSEGESPLASIPTNLKDIPGNLSGLFRQATNLVMKPIDWVIEQVVPDDVVDTLSDAIGKGLGMLSDASTWTIDEDALLETIRRNGIEAESLADLRNHPLEELDVIARKRFSENAILAAVEGGGTSLGGPLFIAADIPLLFTINFRVIQQIGATYGFPLRGEEFQPLVIAIYNAAVSDSHDSRQAALRELSVAAAAFAHDTNYRGRKSQTTFREQNRHIPRELAKNLAARKLGQLIPIAGAAIGAGVNYWFTEQTSQTAYMLFRSLYLERKERV